MSQNNTEVAKRVVEEAFDIKRELQYQEMQKWDDGELSALEALNNIAGLESLIIVQEKFGYYREQVKLAQAKDKK